MGYLGPYIWPYVHLPVGTPAHGCTALPYLACLRRVSVEEVNGYRCLNETGYLNLGSVWYNNGNDPDI